MTDPTREELLVAAAIDFASAEALVVRADKIDPDNNPIDAACVAMARALLKNGWQPIETAPKDGTPILVHGTKGWIGRAQWNADENCFEDEHREFVEASWLTHWRHLPAPPAEKSNADKEPTQ